MADQTAPKIFVTTDGVPRSITILQTQAQLEDQGYTYNQAGFSYNQLGVMYGGIYKGNQDIVPLKLTITGSREVSSMSLSFRDIYMTNIPNNIQSIGPGFFMFITH